MNGSDKLEFAEERPREAVTTEPWQLLIVDDDKEIHAVTKLMLENCEFGGRRVALLHAHSAAAARELLKQHPDIALVLLDVVMETEHAGLELARYIRQELGNYAVRILLRTGQPGQTPAQQVVAKYDIDDYLPKSELRFQRLHILVTATLRTYSLLRQLNARQSELKRSNEQLEQYAYTDTLTGLMNRRRFEQHIDGEWRRALRQGVPLTALMIDVDYFKAYNDTYGHPAGDRVLRQVAQVLSEQIARPGDSVCRYGGEEFLALLPGTALAQGLEIGEHIRRRVEALAVPHEQSPHNVLTISAGGAFVKPEPNAAATGYEALVNAADQGLYRAKNEGRNRVAACPES